MTRAPFKLMSREPKWTPKELDLHIATARLLKQHCLPDWCWTHIASGEHRDYRTACKLKAMGVRPGWPDFALLGPSGRFHALELKRAGQKLTEAQEDFRLWCIAHGVPYAVAYSIGDVLYAFEAWGCLRVKVHPEPVEGAG